VKPSINIQESIKKLDACSFATLRKATKEETAEALTMKITKNCYKPQQ